MSRTTFPNIDALAEVFARRAVDAWISEQEQSNADRERRATSAQKPKTKAVRGKAADPKPRRTKSKARR